MPRKDQISPLSPRNNFSKSAEGIVPSQEAFRYPVFPVSSATIDRLQKLQDYLQVRSKLLFNIRSASLAALSELQVEEALLENAIERFPSLMDPLELPVHARCVLPVLGLGIGDGTRSVQ